MDLTKRIRDIFPAGPSWPFRTQSARTVWANVEKILEKNPNTRVSSAISQALYAAEIPTRELTPEDMQILSMAIRWKVYALTGCQPMR